MLVAARVRRTKRGGTLLYASCAYRIIFFPSRSFCIPSRFALQVDAKEKEITCREDSWRVKGFNSPSSSFSNEETTDDARARGGHTYI